ncbi:MAG: hypothetical protein GQ527_10415 [Bacteroidales bacterium]|nr:hypothetical protein [Bacteroidales bacterium]
MIQRKLLLILVLIMSSLALWSQQTMDSSQIIKVLSFNILHGETMNHQYDLDMIAQVIIDADADFVALQEVDFKTQRAKNYDLVTELAWRCKMAPLFGKAMDYDGGEYGEGILSKYTFLQSRNVTLPHSEGNEVRAALEITTILSSGDTISFIGTHLDHLEDETDRVAQVKEINRVFSSNNYPTILAGDLNAIPESNPIQILEQIWAASYDRENPKPTYPSNQPSVKIDYVMFYPKEKWRVLKTEIIQDSIASDHCAYLVYLELLD